MQNKEKWVPTIYSVDDCGNLCVSKKYLAGCSEITLRLYADMFNEVIKKYAKGNRKLEHLIMKMSTEAFYNPDKAV